MPGKGYPVRKSGAKTGVTAELVRHLDVDDSTVCFSQGGGSGAFIMDAQNKVLGLLIGRNCRSASNDKITIANHMTEVVAATGIEVPPS